MEEVDRQNKTPTEVETRLGLLLLINEELLVANQISNVEGSSNHPHNSSEDILISHSVLSNSSNNSELL